jgi:methyl-accepting chemotaxis protein
MLKLSGLNSKITLLLALTLSIVFLFLALITISQDIKTTKNRINDQATSFASLSKEKYIQYFTLYYESGFFKFSELVSGLNQLNKDLTKIQIYSTKGELLFDSDEIEKGKTTETNRVVTDEFMAQKLQKPDQTQGEIIKNKIHYLEIIEPYIDEWGRHDYTIAYYFSFQSLTENVINAVVRTIIILLLFLIIAIVFFILLSNKFIIKPIEMLLEGVKVIQNGNLDYRISSISTDEIGELTTGFNQMVVNLKKSKDEIDAYNKNLEQTIINRTEALNTKVADIERLNALMVGRELTMIEMKKKMHDLEEQLQHAEQKN